LAIIMISRNVRLAALNRRRIVERKSAMDNLSIKTYDNGGRDRPPLTGMNSRLNG
jgi:hypothetical protein